MPTVSVAFTTYGASVPAVLDRIGAAAAFHENLHQSIRDLNRCRPPDLSLMDASVGLAAFHLGGPPCDPPAATLIAGYDPREVDRRAAGLLGLDWRRIPHLA